MNPLRATSSMLCSVALLTVTPPTNTGLSFAAGVSAPVRPTLKITSSSKRHLFVGRELVRQRPARRARDEAELLLVGAAIYLVDHAIDLVRQLGRGARRCRGSTRGNLRRQRLSSPSGQVRRPNGLSQGASSLCLSGTAPPSTTPSRIEEEIQRPRRGDARVELAQAARSRIARIHIELVAACQPRRDSFFRSLRTAGTLRRALRARRVACRAAGAARSGWLRHWP